MTPPGVASSSAGKPLLVLATGNAAKLAVLRRVIGGSAHIVPREDPPDPDKEEPTGTSVEAIAVAKARSASRTLRGALVVATDGGLLVPGLGSSWNPLLTRRFAGTDASNRERAAALLRRAAHLDGDDRRIGWREALAVARNGRVLAAWAEEGIEGRLCRDVDPDSIAHDGFWVPAIWVCPEFGGRRLAALSDAERAARDDHWKRLGREVRRFVASRSRPDLARDV